MKAAIAIVFTGLVFLWLNFIAQFFIVSGLVVLISACLALGFSYCFFKNEPMKFTTEYWYLALPLLIPILWQAIKVVYVDSGDIWVWNYNNYGDMPYHLGLSNYLQHTKFWPQNFIFSEETLKYPFAVDYLHGILQNFLSFEYVYPMLSILGLFLTAFIAWQIGGVGFLYILFCNGSWAFAAQDQVSWKNFLLALFIPQRGYLLALPIGLLLVHKMWIYIQANQKLTFKEVGIYGFLLGSLAWVHLHTFVFFILFSSLIYFYRRQKEMFFLILMALGMGLPFVLIATDFLQKASSVSFRLLWDKSSDLNVISYLFQNFGFVLILPLCLPWIKDKSIRTWLFYATFLFAFFLICILSVWPWDNIKILFWAYVTFMFGLYQTISNRQFKILFVLLFSLPGLYNIWSYTFQKNNKQSIFLQTDIDLYKDWFKDQINDEVYIAAPTFNHPIFYYGAATVMGYEGHLWSHGVDYMLVKDKVSRMATISSAELKSFAIKNGAKYLIFSSLEKAIWGSPVALEDFERAYTNKDLVIYKMY